MFHMVYWCQINLITLMTVTENLRKIAPFGIQDIGSSINCLRVLFCFFLIKNPPFNY